MSVNGSNNKLPLSIRLIQPGPDDRYITCIPLVPLKIAAGAFSDPQNVDEENFEWVQIQTKRKLHCGMFVAQVVGQSMEPLIPDGSYCLFSAPVTGTRQGKIVLVQLRDEVDPDTGERYTLKKYESRKITNRGSWRHGQIILKPINPAFSLITLAASDGESIKVIAEFVSVLPNS